MKITKIKQELKSRSHSDLQEQLMHAQRELFTLHIHAKTAHIKDNSTFKKLKKLIARIHTFMREKELLGN